MEQITNWHLTSADQHIELSLEMTSNPAESLTWSELMVIYKLVPTLFGLFDACGLLHTNE